MNILINFLNNTIGQKILALKGHDEHGREQGFLFVNDGNTMLNVKWLQCENVNSIEVFNKVALWWFNN
jgi:hypothetical protein